jgi:hypothetical protein
MTLADFGLTQTQSERFGLLARVPDAVFEGWLVQQRKDNERLAKVNAYALAKPDKVAQEARAEVMAAWHADDATPVFAAFGKAVERLIASLSELPTDELADVAGLIRSLVEAYNAAKAARS